MHGTISEMTTTIDAQEFLEQLGPTLFNGKLEDAAGAIRKRWNPEQITQLLQSPCPDVRKVAALGLALVGDRSTVRPLAIALHDPDQMVNQLAEHALWTIWFRLGKPEAVRLVKLGNRHLQHNNHYCAIEQFGHAIELDADFPEAYNQLAIALYLSDRFEDAVKNCRAALARMPEHFGAMASMGHSYAHLGCWGQAKKCYRLALAIHPRLEGIQASLTQINALLKETDAA